MAEEREVVARLKVQKDGDTGAFKETAADVRDLKEEAQSATPAVEGLGEAASEAGDAAGDAGKGLEEMGDGAQGAGRSMGDLKTQVVAAAAAFKAGYELGSALRDILNDITKGGFDRGIQSIVTATLGLEEGLDDGADAAQRLQNQMRILKANGIDPVGLSAAEVEKKVQDLAKAKNDAAKASEDLAKAEEEWAEKLGLSGKALDESSKKLATYIADFAKQNSQLSQTDLAKIFGPMIQDVLDGYARLGKEAPAEVAKLAAGWGVLTTAAQKAANEQKKIVDEMVSDITGAAAGLKGSLQTQLGTLSEVFSKIDFGSLGADQIEKAKTFLTQYIETSRKAGQQIPADVADQAAALGILVNAMEVAGTANEGLRGTEEELKSVVVGTSQTFNAQGQELSRLTTITNQAGAASKNAGAQIKEGGEQAGEGLTPIKDVTAEVTALTSKFREAGGVAKSAGSGIKEGGEAAGEGAKSLKEAGTAGEAAGAGLGAAKTAAEGLGTAADQGKAGVEKLNTSLDGVGAKGQTAATGLQAINAVDLSKIDGALAGVIAKLDAIPAKAAAAKAALDQIDEGG